MTVQFSDSVTGNLELCRELLRGMPAGARERAKRAAGKVEQVFIGLKKDNPKDPAVALGVAFAIFYISEQLVQPDGSGAAAPGDRLIMTLDDL